MNLLRDAITLPAPLQQRLEHEAKTFLQPEGVPVIDFSGPAQEPALMAPDSVSWKVFKNPLAMFIGGVTAVILELAEPRVRTGVWNHTTFRTDALARMRRTGLAAMLTVYGPRSRAEAMIAAVSRMHARIRGLTPAGRPYSADDPELLVWVHATASFGFLEAYHAYVHALRDEERDAYYSEGRVPSRLYGAIGAPTTQQEVHALFETMSGKLEASPIIFEFLDIMQRVPILPRPFTPLQKMLIRAAVELVPAGVRDCVGLGQDWGLRPWERYFLRRGGAMADRILLKSGPAVQSCRRLGLPDDYLYRHT